MPDPHPPRRILVTGVGANPGFGLCCSLLRLGHQIVAVDAHPLAPGLQLDDVLPHVIPRADAPDYPDTMIKLCRDLGGEGIVAGIENDLPPLLDLAPRSKAEGVWLWLPDAESVHDCIDKARFQRVLTRHGIPTPRTWTADDLNLLYGQEATRMAEVLRSGQYGHTDVTEEFERQVAAFLGVEEGVAVASGTAALHTALLAAGVGPGWWRQRHVPARRGDPWRSRPRRGRPGRV
ncbi:DegT/DnrJ/EryC1/StrS family aminotransferase [Streptomyces sp. NPDC094149]|uniref:DegT/DnrJ/EryC1/StrS family aminotransferase n=1 Tax=Streptomyces sp. NPDC094149 TaxID=3155079 RepID=UPI003318A0AF